MTETLHAPTSTASEQRISQSEKVAVIFMKNVPHKSLQDYPVSDALGIKGLDWDFLPDLNDLEDRGTIVQYVARDNLGEKQ